MDIKVILAKVESQIDELDKIETTISTYPDVYGGNVVSGKSIKNITLK